MAKITSVRGDQNSSKAMIFIHGFAGKAGTTWGSFPLIVGAQTTDCDIYTVEYPTSFKPDIFGAWSADPDINNLARLVYTGFSQTNLNNYQEIAIVAHSMGGLIIQRLILDFEDIANRITHLIMFGTPNGGVPLASRFSFFKKRPVVNMKVGSPFITSLRSEWEQNRPGHLRVAIVAGSNDRFVSDESSFLGFPNHERFVVDGDHISLVRPADQEHLAVKLVLNQVALAGHQLARVLNHVEPVYSRDEMLAGSERQADLFMANAQTHDSSGDKYVGIALQLERAGNPHKAVEVLRDFLSDNRKRDQYTSFGRHTNVVGSLGGQLKRIWFRFQEDDAIAPDDTIKDLDQYPALVMQCYTDGLFQSWLNDDYGQIYYHAINVSFCALVWWKDQDLVKRTAQKALNYATAHDTPEQYQYWKYATIAEANLYLGDFESAVEAYRQAFDKPMPYNYDSTIFQALVVVDEMGKQGLIDQATIDWLQIQLEEIFDEETMQVEQQHGGTSVA